MRYMFTMMNNARLSVGLEGLSLAERAFQMALAYAKERRQGRAPGAPAGEQSLIVDHPDVRRMLLTQQASSRRCAGSSTPTPRPWTAPPATPTRRSAPACDELADILTPVSKGWGTDLGVELTSLALQVFGGMGYIEETGVAQHYRDARIAPIYEGTNGIQAMDLVGRKLPMRAGGAVADYLGQIEAHRRRAGRRRATTWRRSTTALADGARRAAHAPPTGSSPTGWPTRSTRWPAPRPTCGCSASSPAAGSWPSRPSRRPRLLADAGAGGQGLLRGQGAHRPVLLRADPAAGRRAGPGRHRHQPRPGRRRALARRGRGRGRRCSSGAPRLASAGGRRGARGGGAGAAWGGERQEVAHVVGDGVHPHPVDLPRVLEQGGVRPRRATTGTSA